MLMVPLFLASDDRFMRKGKVGCYRDELNEELIGRIDEWSKRMLKDSDFKFFK